MRAVVQRVSEASVSVDGEVVGEIGRGLLVLLGVAKGDGEEDAHALADKVAKLRIFSDEQGKMNRSLIDVGGAALVVSQFTLYADAKTGRRPSFSKAAGAEEANRLYRSFIDRLQEGGLAVQEGRFGAMMAVRLLNDGPVTLLLDTEGSL